MGKRVAWQLVLERFGLADERAARALIMAGQVRSANAVLDRPSALLDETAVLTRDPVEPYVSRAGAKLAFALAHFRLSLTDKVVLDIGSSTGGFVDCALQHGARRVYAVDVGTNQLAYGLRCDPRVVVMENTNVKTLTPAMFDPLPDVATCDVSFISLRHVFKALAPLAKTVVALIKPQFEASRAQMAGTAGLCPVELHAAIIAKVEREALQHGYALADIAPSPVAGKVSGNVEYVSL